MLVRTRLKWAVALAALALAAPPAIAQTVGDRPDARVDVRRPVNIPMDEQLKEADGVLGRMEMARGQVRRQLEKARAQRDVVKTLCLNDKLNQLDVTKRTAAERAQSLKAAVDRKDAEGSSHEYTIVKVLQQRSDQLVQEANSCVGEQEAFLANTRVTQVLDKNLPPPANETDFPGKDPGLVTDVPKCTSCIR